MKSLKSKMKNLNRGFSLIEAIVGTAMMLVVFLGIFGAYRLALRMIIQSRNRITAVAVANKYLEMARNLPYQSVGVRGGFPDGVMENSTTTVRNGTRFLIENRVDYVVDPADGLALPEDECPNDYKKVEVKVSWSSGFSGAVLLDSDISPKNLAEECSTGGGILSVSVFDSQGQMIVSPLIEVKDPGTGDIVKTATPASGQHYFSLATSTYKIAVSQTDYSAEETYASGDVYNGTVIITPEIPHFSVLEAQLTPASFSIDRTAVFSVDTFSPWGTGGFSDSFLNESKISEKSDVEIASGEAGLAIGADGYPLSGYLISTDISPANMTSWGEFSFTDDEPFDTDLAYQVYYASTTGWYFIPESDLPGNAAGFDATPVDLSGLSVSDYFQLRIRGNFSTVSTTTTPVLYDWQVSWIDSEATPISNAPFSLRGNKIVGIDAGGNPIYKYSGSFSSDSSGHKNISGLEWDSYIFSVDPSSGLDLISISPFPQPVGLAPGENLPVSLYLDSENSFLPTLEDSVTLEPVFSGAVRLYNAGLGYNETQYTDEKGQTLFIPLSNATYILEISAPGYASTTGSIAVSGDALKTIKLEQIE